MANSILAKMAVQISANTAEFTKGLNKASSDINKFTNSISDTAKTLGIAFGIQQIASFSLEVIKLAGEADSVKKAFDRLADSRKLLEDLKKATNGTVSELDLMKRAVMASNFDISLKALPKLLEFATLRAQQTGQSVDYLVDSIVTGIGRKSKLILDNLGISAAQLSAEFNGASLEAQSVGDVAEAVGRIAERSLKDMGSYADNAKNSMDQLNASWVNFKVILGETLSESGGSALAKDAATILELLANKTLGWTQKAEILFTTWSNEGISEKLKEWADKMDPILDRQDRLNKMDAQLLINKYEGITQAIEALNSMTAVGTALDENASRQFKNRAEILAILNQRLKSSSESVAKGLEIEAAKASAAAKSYDELFKSKANIGFGGSKTKFIDSTSIDQLQAQVGIDAGSFTGSLGVAKIAQPDSLMDIDGQIKKIKDFKFELKQLQEELKVITVDFGTMIGNFVADIAYAFGQSMTGTVKFGDAFLRGIANFAVQFGEILIAAGFAGKAIQEFGKSNPALAVVAGAALIAVGAALSSSLSSGLNKAAGGFGAGAGGGTRPTVGGLTTNEQRIIIEMKAKGSDLVAVYDSAKADNRIRKGRG